MWSIYYIGENLRRGGRNWSDYLNQFLGNILYYTMPSKDPPDSIRSRTTKAHARKRLLLLGLMDSYKKYDNVPNIELIEERMLKTKPIKYR